LTGKDLAGTAAKIPNTLRRNPPRDPGVVAGRHEAERGKRMPPGVLDRHRQLPPGVLHIADGFADRPDFQRVVRTPRQ